MLSESVQSLVQRHDLVMFDLDGVIKIGPRAVAGAADGVAGVRAAGRPVAFVTNNASKTPEQVAASLTALGVAAEADDVVTSAQAAAALARERHGAGALVHVLGGEGLRWAVAQEGLVEVADPEDSSVLLSGFGPDVRWVDIMRAAVAVRGGLDYIASNADGSFPSEFGEAPGHGVLVGVISAFAGVTPAVAGKPSPPLMLSAVQRAGSSSPLMVGDRVDTDIEGARAAGVASLLVMTGVTDVAGLVAIGADSRPDYVSMDLAGLVRAHPVPALGPDGSAALGGWSARVVGGALVAEGEGDAEAWLACIATAGWHWLDTTGNVARVPEDLRRPLG